MNLANYQVSTNRNNTQGDKSGRQYPSLASQYQDSVKKGTNHPSDVTICCRIKRPIALGKRGESGGRVGRDRGDMVHSALSMNSKRSGRSAKRV